MNADMYAVMACNYILCAQSTKDVNIEISLNETVDAIGDSRTVTRAIVSELAGWTTVMHAQTKALRVAKALHARLCWCVQSGMCTSARQLENCMWAGRKLKKLVADLEQACKAR